MLKRVQRDESGETCRALEVSSETQTLIRQQVSKRSRSKGSANRNLERNQIDIPPKYAQVKAFTAQLRAPIHQKSSPRRGKCAENVDQQEHSGISGKVASIFDSYHIFLIG